MSDGKFDYSKALKAAKKQWDSDNEALENSRAEHGAAQEKLAALRAEIVQLKENIASFENDLESPVSPDEFESALIRQQTLAVLLRRAEAEANRASGVWQDFQRQRSRNAQRARATVLRGFDEWSKQRRAELVTDFQPLL